MVDLRVAVIVAVDFELTFEVVILKVVLVFPAGKEIVVGQVASLELLANDTESPLVGAGASSVTVPVVDFPDETAAGLSFRLASDGATMDKLVVTTVPLAFADKAVEVSVATGRVLTMKVAEDLPLGIVTDAGICTVPDALESAATRPPFGADPLSVTFPVMDKPPVIELLLTESTSRTAG